MKDKLKKAGNTYSSDNINIFNELFYKYAKSKLINNLPNLFTKLDLFNVALHTKITEELNLDEIKVIELAAGAKIDKWETFIEIDKRRKWNVFLTDFDKKLLPSIKTFKKVKNFKFRTSTHSLFDVFSKLSKSKKYDVMLSTYTFDNLWLKDDFHLTKVGNVWHKNLYKLDLSKVKKSLECVGDGKRLEKQFFKDLSVKIKKEKIDIFSLKHGDLIDKYYKNFSNASVNYPGGLIKTVEESFNNQLKKEGLFITADMAVIGNRNAKSFVSVNETIKIKVENYSLAKFVLEKLGFNVELKNLHEFIKEAGIKTPVKIYDHFVLVVKKKS